ncbi:MAG: Uma2 family endonuclease [Polyangiaceae bacterium]
MLSAQPVLHFPEQAEVPETKDHLELRTLLYQFLMLAFSEVAKVGSEQFVYWDPTDTKACVAPDAFVRFGAPDERFRSWKVWEHGAPHVAVEIVSDSDRPEWGRKLERYRRMGVSELVTFDPEFPEQPLRIWDFVGDDLLERTLLEPCAKSQHLGGYWLAVEVPRKGLTLRLSHDEHGEHLFPTSAEAEARRAEAEARRADLLQQELDELKASLKRDS